MLAGADGCKTNQSRSRIMTTSSISEEKQQDIFELEQLADKELEKLHERLQFNTASIQIIRNRQRYHIGAFGCLKNNDPRLLRGIDHDERIKPIVTAKKITISNNITKEDNWSTEVTPEVRSWICAPLVVDDEVIGLLTIDSHNPTNSYTYEKHEKLVKDFAHDAASRIKRWLSLYESKRRANQLESLIAIGNQLTSNIELNEEALFSLVEKCAREALNIQNVTIWMMNDAEKVCPVKVSRGGEVITTNEEEDTKGYWKARDKNEGKGKVRYVLDKNRSLVLYSQYIFDEEKYVLFSNDGEKYPFSSLPNQKTPDDKVPDCWIGVPIKLQNKVSGVISAFSWGHEYQFAAEYDSKILEVLADKTAIALDNIRKYKEANKLRNVIDFISNITSKINLSESEILELIHQQASKFMYADNMYIALYDEYNDEIRFSLVYEKGEKVKRKPRKRKTGEEEGKTEYIIRTGESLFHPTEKESKEWYVKNNKKIPWKEEEEKALPPSPSWIGVPMLLEDKVLGVIAIYHPSEEGRYSRREIEILKAIGAAATIALRNADNYNKSEQWAFLGQLSASLAHRIGNKGGLIRLCAENLRKHLSAKEEDNSLLDQIEIIDRSCRYLLKLSDSIFIPIKAIQEKLINIDISYHLDNAIKYALIPDDISIVAEYRNKKIPVAVGNSYLTEAFLEIIVNAIEAMEENSSKEKKIIIDAVIDNDIIKIIFSDTGKGIKQDGVEIFGFFSKKDDKKIQKGHKGFGLWWIKNFLEEYINGKIEIKSRLDGTDFIVSLPVKK